MVAISPDHVVVQLRHEFINWCCDVVRLDITCKFIQDSPPPHQATGESLGIWEYGYLLIYSKTLWIDHLALIYGQLPSSFVYILTIECFTWLCSLLSELSAMLCIQRSKRIPEVGWHKYHSLMKECSREEHLTSLPNREMSALSSVSTLECFTVTHCPRNRTSNMQCITEPPGHVAI